MDHLQLMLMMAAIMIPVWYLTWRGWTKPEYCTKCGKSLKLITFYSGKYDRHTGVQDTEEVWACQTFETFGEPHWWSSSGGQFHNRVYYDAFGGWQIASEPEMDNL